MIVKVNESKLGEDNWDKRLGQWVFGGVCHEIKKCFLTMVENHTSEILQIIINNKIQPGTTIYSDY